MDEDVREQTNNEDGDDPRQTGNEKPGTQTWPVIGGKPGKNQGEE